MNKFQKIKCLFHTNLIKTLYVNLKLLPLKQALRFPVLLYGDVYLELGDDAKIVFGNGGGHFASVKIGNTASVMFGSNVQMRSTILIWKGTIIFNGLHHFIGNGSQIYVEQCAQLILGEYVNLTANVKIGCQKEIIIGNRTGISWECQIFDSNFHYMVDDYGCVKHKEGAIHIGQNCWIGNRVTIEKGTCLSDNMIVASNSIVCNDFSQYPNCIIGGIPAKLLKYGYARIKNYGLQEELDKFYADNPTITQVKVNRDECFKYNSKDNFHIVPLQKSIDKL